MRLKRVYYSTYVPINHDPRLPTKKPQLLREHRLYQADWLIRLYGFKAEEILDAAHPDLSVHHDPKVMWALSNPGFFPVEMNTADYEVLLRVPGIGLISAKKIVAQRRIHKLCYEDLHKIGVVLKRAQYFITVNGRFHGAYAPGASQLAKRLAEPGAATELEFDFTGVSNP